ncbi:MAG: DUF4392 domain-containing protein [Thermovirga sp.]
MKASRPAETILGIVASDRCGRSLPRLCSAEMLEEAAVLLDACARPVIVTGFYVPQAGAPETDGPPGAAVIARALRESGKEPIVATDEPNSSAVEACCRVLGLDGPAVVGDSCAVMGLDPDLLVFIERLGRAGDGKYYNMRGDDISGCTPPLDFAADEALAEGIPVLAVGDGGNEAGMACLMPGMGSLLPGFRGCLSAVGSTVAIPVDVSNWGGYALACMLSFRNGRWLGHSPEEELAMIGAMIEAGAVDGVTGRRILSVDGMGADVHQEVVERIRDVFKGSNGKRRMESRKPGN